LNQRPLKVYELAFSPQSEDLHILKNYQQEMESIKNIGDVLVGNKYNIKGCK
jgi:hypothetical protein